MHPGEEINRGSRLEELINIYARKNIGGIFRLSVLEFMDLPRDVIDMLINTADIKTKENTNNVDDLLSKK